jgi:NAD(P)-dependent dehydrogenase (short-subunit alcohol dehydrogenase family)
MKSWTLTDAPRLDGKRAIVTGATGGIGYETALGLARLGATTVLTGRNRDKGAAALARIRHQVPAADVRFDALDLASLASVAAFAGAWDRPLDILVNNAGVMGLPARQVTTDGFEQQIGVNYLAHFALTARLKPALCAAPGGGRVVSVASLAHRRGVLDLSDLNSERSYVPMRAYARTKLAMLMFALELHRRAQVGGWTLRSFAAHPGWANTDIVGNGFGRGIKGRIAGLAFGLVAQSAADGALPSLYAAAAAEAVPGGYYGPTGPGETRGPPGPSRVFPRAVDQSSAVRLWALSEELTRLRFD